MFKPKGEDEIRQEVIEDFKGDTEDFDPEEYEDKITRITQRRLKDEQFKASVHKSKEEKKAKLAEMEQKMGAGSNEQKPKGNDELELSIKDSARLQQANIPVDDWDEVVSYAKFKGISITDALGSSVVKSTLRERQEERQTAEATNVGKARRGTSKVSGQKLAEEASKSGKLPETDEEMQALIAQRYSKGL
jgi:hypothetical protein